ncbi:hypothetical protein [Marinobacter aromaticivorans]|uniref:Uncharacterized protein n=1 Tax=Marinobacter aromaticivorans TaxID=1494078 RepID=A0ABW2IXY0_9GAMM|nr:hypothetical protein [Marinobacter aromaticivorans]
MKMLLSITAIVLLGAWSFGSTAQEQTGRASRNFIELGGEVSERGAVLDALYPEEMRLVIDDNEYFLGGAVTVNGQVISASSAMAVLREGQRLLNVVSERDGDTGRLVLYGVDTL